MDSKEKKIKKEKKGVPAVKHAELAYRILIEPWITEKTHAAAGQNKYTFKVSKNADKMEVKKAVEGFYHVTVAGVAVTNIPEKKKNYGRYETRKAGFKKATVTLKEGDKIEFFQGA